MWCAPCAQRAKERRERMMEQLQISSTQPDTEVRDSTYKETDVNSAYAEFKRKLEGYNSQALYNNKDQ